MKTILILVFARVQVEVKHGIASPVLLQLFHCQSFEQFLFSEEICLHGANEQTLAKTAGTAEEIVSYAFCQFINQPCLVDVQTSLLAYLLEILYANWIKHNCSLFCSLGASYNFSLKLMALMPDF